MWAAIQTHKWHSNGSLFHGLWNNLYLRGSRLPFIQVSCLYIQVLHTPLHKNERREINLWMCDFSLAPHFFVAISTGGQVVGLQAWWSLITYLSFIAPPRCRGSTGLLLWTWRTGCWVCLQIVTPSPSTRYLLDLWVGMWWERPMKDVARQYWFMFNLLLLLLFVVVANQESQ